MFGRIKKMKEIKDNLMNDFRNGSAGVEYSNDGRNFEAKKLIVAAMVAGSALLYPNNAKANDLSGEVVGKISNVDTIAVFDKYKPVLEKELKNVDISDHKYLDDDQVFKLNDFLSKFKGTHKEETVEKTIASSTKNIKEVYGEEAAKNFEKNVRASLENLEKENPKLAKSSFASGAIENAAIIYGTKMAGGEKVDPSFWKNMTTNIKMSYDLHTYTTEKNQDNEKFIQVEELVKNKNNLKI